VIRLPTILAKPSSAGLCGLLWLPYICVYQVINRYPLFTPTELPLTPLDLTLPFVPSLLPLYVAYIPFYWWTGVRAEDNATFNRFFYATHLQLILCGFVWVLSPVTMPREMFYQAASYNWADTFWRWFDAPNNCLPSLHAANCLLFIRFNWHRSHRWLSTAIAIAIIASTVLVKQHYVADVVAGAIVYALTAAFLSHLEVVDPATRRTALTVPTR
jgi:membrane-associated phospholipid phosphatase